MNDGVTFETARRRYKAGSYTCQQCSHKGIDCLIVGAEPISGPIVAMIAVRTSQTMASAFIAS